MPPVSYAYVDRQYKRHYATQKRITGQVKVKKTSGPQTVKTHIKSFFAFRILYMFSHLYFADSISHFIRCSFSHFRSSHFIRALSVNVTHLMLDLKYYMWCCYGYWNRYRNRGFSAKPNRGFMPLCWRFQKRSCSSVLTVPWTLITRGLAGVAARVLADYVGGAALLYMRGGG